MSLRMVLVDDHSILRDGIRFLLARETDIEIVGEASTVYEALSQVRLKKPDLVIMDLQLPDGNGIDATRMIRTEQALTRVLIVSGSRPDQSIREALEAGASGFVFKEDASEELVRAIRCVMQGKTYLCPAAATVFVQAGLQQTKSESPTESTAEVTLSERELQVLKRVADGLRNKEIADELKIGIKSVETYRSRLMRKLHCESSADLVRQALRRGLSRL